MTVRSMSAVALAAALLLALPACKKKGGGSGGGGDADPGLKRQSANNLKQIARAMHDYHDAHNGFPRGVYGPDGKSLGLSWRVALLPYVQQHGLYQQFKLNEPWDSEHNKRLIAMMPSVYVAPGKGSADGRTYYCAFEGKNGLMRPLTAPGTPGTRASGLGIFGIMDGTSNTIMVAEAGEPVIWTKPEDIPFDPSRPLPPLGGVFRDGAVVAFCDGSVRLLKRGAPEASVKVFITPDGGEVAADDIFGE